MSVPTVTPAMVAAIKAKGHITPIVSASIASNPRLSAPLMIGFDISAISPRDSGAVNIIDIAIGILLCGLSFFLSLYLSSIFNKDEYFFKCFLRGVIYHISLVFLDVSSIFITSILLELVVFLLVFNLFLGD